MMGTFSYLLSVIFVFIICDWLIPFFPSAKVKQSSTLESYSHRAASHGYTTTTSSNVWFVLL